MKNLLLGIMEPKKIEDKQLFQINSPVSKLDCSKVLARLANVDSLIDQKSIPIAIKIIGKNVNDYFVTLLIVDSPE